MIDDENIMDIGEKINIVAESLSQDTGINASDIRESIFNDFHESDSMSENVINAIDYATAQNSMDAEPTTLENLSYGDMDIDEYIKGVLAAEMPVSFPPEALKAQAVAARTYAGTIYLLYIL